MLQAHPDFQSSTQLKLQLARALNVHGTNLSLIAGIANQEELLPHNSRPARDFDRPPAPRRRPLLLNRGFTARSQIDHAIRITDELILEEPENDAYRSVRANSYCSLAALELTDPRISLDIAMVARDLAISELEALNKRDPDNPEYLYLLAITFSLNDDLGEREHLRSINRSISISSDLANQYPNVLDYAMLEAVSRIKLARFYYSDQQIDRAFSQLMMAKTAIVRQLEQTPSDRLFGIGVDSMIQSFDLLAYEYALLGNRSKSKQAEDSATELIRLLPKGPRRRGQR